LVEYLQGEGVDCYTPAKYEDIAGIKLGHVIDCIGLSADFRTRPFDTVEAHVCRLIKILRQCQFDSFLYLSSTRAYGIREGIAKEGNIIHCQPLDFDDLYNISKIMGEAICSASGRDNVKVVRLSNVYGYDEKSENFIFTLIRDALHKGKIVLNTTLDSNKDHINVEDVVDILPGIAMYGKNNIYNVANGKNTTVGEITKKLSELTGCSVEVGKDAQKICCPRICIDRIKEEFAFSPSNILDDLERLVEKYKESA
jgi:nucleoside-diphosphate-sugar epimerase